MNLQKELVHVNNLLAAHRSADSILSPNFNSSPAKLYQEIVNKGGCTRRVKERKLPKNLPNIEQFLEVDSAMTRFGRQKNTLEHLLQKCFAKPPEVKLELRPSASETFEALLPPKRKFTSKNLEAASKSPSQNTLEIRKRHTFSMPMMSFEEWEKTMIRNKDDDEFKDPAPRRKAAVMNSAYTIFKSLLLGDKTQELEGFFHDDFQFSDKDHIEFLFQEAKNRELDLSQAALAGKMPVAPQILSLKQLPRLNTQLNDLQHLTNEVLDNPERYGHHQKLKYQHDRCHQRKSFKVMNPMKSLAEIVENSGCEKCDLDESQSELDITILE